MQINEITKHQLKILAFLYLHDLLSSFKSKLLVKNPSAILRNSDRNYEARNIPFVQSDLKLGGAKLVVRRSTCDSQFQLAAKHVFVFDC